MHYSRLCIDTLRGLACLLLVAFHVVGHSESTGMKLPEEHAWAQVNEWLGLLRMPVFSFLSGWVYALRPMQGPIGPFLRGKTRRLLVPMLLVGTGFAILQSVTRGAHGGDYDWRLLHIVPVAHYWFLEALFIVFALTALLERAGWLSTPQGFAAVWLGAAVLHVTAPVPIYFGLEGATYLLPFFLMGIAVHRFHGTVSRAEVSRSLALVLVGIGLYWGLVEPPVLSLASPLNLSASVCILLLLLSVRPQLAWLAWVGRWSFGIYLFHPVFTAASRNVLIHIGIHQLPLLLGAGLAAGLAGPILFTAALRKVPLGWAFLGERPPRTQRLGDTARAPT